MKLRSKYKNNENLAYHHQLLLLQEIRKEIKL
jgi:hypothetical protein